MKFRRKFFLLSLISFLLLTLCACSKQPQESKAPTVVTTTNIYADIAQNVLGKYGKAQAIIQSGNTDPHDFEPTTNNAKTVAKAKIVVANGLGYDSWMNNLAAANDQKILLVGEDLMGLKKGDNPHIWYNLSMPSRYVHYLVKRLSKLQPQHAVAFKRNGQRYLAKIARLQKAAHQLKGKAQKPVFVSEPVFDYALTEAGYQVGDKGFEEAVENGTDPSPQMINHMNKAIKQKKIAFFVNNTQASSPTVNNFVSLARKNGIPVLSVRETIPSHLTYLAWMTANYDKLIRISKVGGAK